MPKHFYFSAILLIWGCTTAAYAQNRYQCSNPLSETSCVDQNCAVKTESFTPFSIMVETNHELSICAYSGCWNGKAHYTQRSPFHIYKTTMMKWNDRNKEPVPFVLVIDPQKQLGTLLGEGFILALQCQTEPPQ